jgi:hypothetical protein
MIEVKIYDPVVRQTGKDPLTGKIRIEFIIPKRPFLFWSSYAVEKHIQYPKGYGVAYRDWNSNRILMAPMPFNILIGFLTWSYDWTRMGFAGWCWRHRPK